MLDDFFQLFELLFSLFLPFQTSLAYYYLMFSQRTSKLGLKYLFLSILGVSFSFFSEFTKNVWC